MDHQSNATVLEFDGANDLVTINAKNFTGAENLTIAARIKRNRTGGSPVGYIFGSTRLGLYIDRDNKRMCFDDNIRVLCTGFNSVQLDVWQHVAVVQDISNSRVTFYINGVATQYGGRAGSTAATQFALGNYPTVNGPVRPFAGLMSDVQVYKRALSAAEIQTVYGGQAVPVCTECVFLCQRLARGGDSVILNDSGCTDVFDGYQDHDGSAYSGRHFYYYCQRCRRRGDSHDQLQSQR